MDAKTREKMVKCLELTRSDSDGEALNAIRMANRLREKMGVSWEQLLDGAGAGSSRSPFDDLRRAAEEARRRAADEERARQWQQARQAQAARERREKEAQERAWRQQQERYRRTRPSDDFGHSEYRKPKDWNDVWGV